MAKQENTSTKEILNRATATKRTAEEMFYGGKFSVSRWTAFRNSQAFESNDQRNNRLLPETNELLNVFGFTIDDVLQQIEQYKDSPRIQWSTWFMLLLSMIWRGFAFILPKIKIKRFRIKLMAVSYTHLTLPTKRIV